jgi:hypothetical protein
METVVTRFLTQDTELYQQGTDILSYGMINALLVVGTMCDISEVAVELNMTCC